MIKNIINQSNTTSFLIAYSGGLDSTVLLHQMFQIKIEMPQINIRAIHINHNFNIKCNYWIEHCKKKCAMYKIPLIIENIYINQKTNNIEEQLRIKRYQIIYKNVFDNEIIMTGHHANDQCETLILSLKRGSGPTGLSGMSNIHYINDKKIVRPFLYTTREELKSWAIFHQLKWIEDNSNTDLHYDRNFIRHKIMPILEQRWPQFLKNCIRTSDICRIETQLLNNFLKKEIRKYIFSDNSLDISFCKKIHEDKCKALIRYWLSLQMIKMPSYQNIQNIYHQIIFSRLDANPKIILKKKEIRRYKNKIYLIDTRPIMKDIILFWHNTNNTLVLPNQLGQLSKTNTGFTLPSPMRNDLINVRFQYEGKILIIGRHKSRTIKKIWQEKNIPPWLRNQIPLLFYNDCFISALGIFVINTRSKNIHTWNVSWKNDIKKNIDSNSFVFI